MIGELRSRDQRIYLSQESLGVLACGKIGGSRGYQPGFVKFLWQDPARVGEPGGRETEEGGVITPSLVGYNGGCPSTLSATFKGHRTCKPRASDSRGEERNATRRDETRRGGKASASRTARSRDGNIEIW